MATNTNTNRTQTPVLDREFLEVRALILQLGAALDRMDRSDQISNNDVRWQRIRQGLAVLADASLTDADRAAQVQLIFSRPYESNWRQQFEI
jgi:hypothetical protein